MAQHRRVARSGGRAECGFTLVEILLAVTLLSIIVTVMYSAFHIMGRVVRRTEETKGAYQTARLIMSRMRQDLGCAYFSPTTKNFIFRGENFEEADGDSDALTFVTTGHIVSGRDAPEGDLAEVSYYLDEDNPGILVRREDISPDEELETGGVLGILGKRVLGLNFTYFDGTEETEQGSTERTSAVDETIEERDAWKEEWDSEESPYLPRAVRIDLSLLNEEGEAEDFSTTVVLAMGRTPTSLEPTQQSLGGTPTRAGSPTGRSGQMGRPAGAGSRRGPGQERGDRRGFRPGGDRRGDFTPGGDQRGDRRGTGRVRSSSGYGQRPRPSTAPRIQRNLPNAGSGMRPPTPGGR